MKKLIAIAAVVAALVPVTAGPAAAAGGGEVWFNCTAKLSAFPSASGSGTCEGGARLGSRGVGCIAGVDTNSGSAYAACSTHTTPANNFVADFTYSEACVAGEPPAIGSAEGSATISGLTGVWNGTVTTASAEVDFIWTRVGANAAIQITAARVNIGGNTVTGIGVAEAAFAPLLTQDNLCPEGGPLEAEVTGTAQIALP